MTASDVHTTPAAIRAHARPPCSRCGARMWLAKIEPEHPGYETRLFECTACGAVENIVVKIK